MASTRPSTTEEKQIIAEGAAVFGAWGDGKPMNILLTLLMSLSMRVAARMSVDEGKLIEYMREHYRQARQSRSLQLALGEDAATLIDGERRIILPGEQPL